MMGHDGFKIWGKSARKCVMLSLESMYFEICIKYNWLCETGRLEMPNKMIFQNCQLLFVDDLGDRGDEEKQDLRPDAPVMVGISSVSDSSFM